MEHYIPSAAISILCLGEDCPICQKNSQLIKVNQGVKYAYIKGLIPRQERYMVNVYNRTYVKVSPSGKVVYADLGGEFPKNVDGETLEGIEPKPINQVEVLERGYELFAELQILHKTVVNASNEHICINNFDIVLTYPGGKTSPKAQPSAFMDEVNVPPESYYVLSSLGIQLTPSEVDTKAISSALAKAAETWQCRPIFLAAESRMLRAFLVWPILRHKLGGRAGHRRWHAVLR